jgi:hypothetical protein
VSFRLHPTGHESLDLLNTGWSPNPAAAAAFLSSLPHPGTLAAAAPQMMGDGKGQDILSYKAFKEVEILSPDGTVWKPKGQYPPYIGQLGNNCTSEGRVHTIDLLQAMEAAAPGDGATDTPVVHRACVEWAYASGLYAANMRGDQGCYGSAMAKASYEIGELPYRAIDAPYEETKSRLQSWSNNPKAVVDKYGDKAAPFKTPAPVKITTTEEAVAWLANTGGVTIASDVGFNVPRDARGVCRRAGSWAHQMCLWGVIVSDGVDTFVVCQSWGPHQPSGPQPFDLPGNCFRATFGDVAAVLAQGDSWGYRKFPGFERRPLPSRWTDLVWA